jgi:parallel beta-helix repeat protein
MVREKRAVMKTNAGSIVAGFFVVALMGLSGCGEPVDKAASADGSNVAVVADFQKQLRTQLIMAKTGDVIEIPKGRFEITRGLSLKVDGVTIRGAGMAESVLTFKQQTQGAEGLIVTADDIVLEGFAVEDTKGDAIKINECRNLVIREVRVEWTAGPDEANGAYGLYPVQCENVLIDGAVAIGASDAGIYVGQSRNVVVKNSRAAYNVAGIEIENTIDADVFDNVAENNTGGILVFNLPGLSQRGERTRVFRNRIVSNNTDNFAPEGSIVAGVPVGSGVLINANDHVHIFDNEFEHNDTANVIVSSYFSTADGAEIKNKTFDPYAEAIYIHDNSYVGGGESPDTLELKTLKLAMYGLDGRFPDVIWDGYINPAVADEGKLPATLAICLQDAQSKMLNVDAPNGYNNPNEDMANHRCELAPLKPVELPFG